MLTDSARRKAAPRPETFLQFVGLKLMGPPTSAGNRWVWPCPACGHETAFSTLPPHPDYKDRVRCFRCLFKGDEADLLKQCLEGQDWPARRTFLEQLRAEYDALPSGARVHGRSSTNHPSGNGERRRRPALVYDQDPRFWDGPEYGPPADELLALAGGDPHDAATREKLLHYQEALEVCGRRRCHPEALAARLGAVEWVGRQDAEHMAECRDPECDWYCCRLARGWTPEQIKADALTHTSGRSRLKRRSFAQTTKKGN
jgi:hypothetical protein